MGLITYLFHRSTGLSNQRFKQFFLDMGENIHFHYRDLRIEFSVEEFRELAAKFDECKAGVLKEIDGGYRDGVLPNTNENATINTFWPEERGLVHPVKYNDNDISLEETADGYHLHLRNYKILLDKKSFTHLAEAMAEALAQLKNSELVRDPLSLLNRNDLGPRLLSRLVSEDGENLHIEIESRFLGKASRVLKALGYNPLKSEGPGKIFVLNNSTINLLEPGKARDAVPNIPSLPLGNLDLVSFLARYAPTLDGDSLNTLKLKVLYLYKLAELKKIPPFRLEDVLVDPRTVTPRVDLFAERGKTVPEKEYSRFKSLISGQQLSLVKPRKKILPPPEQERLQAKFMNYLIEKIIPHPCVSRIYVSGSSTRMKSGEYSVPFIHIEWGKLKSDFDIYIDIDPDHENDIPEEWDRKFTYNKNGTVYYHLGDVGDGAASEYAAKYPEIRFYEHVIEAYLFFPSKGNALVKEAALKRSKAQLVFARESIRDWVEKTFGFGVVNAARFPVKTFNKIYRITGEEKQYALKVYLSKFLNKRRRENIPYEVDILNALRDSGLELPFPIPDQNGRYINMIGEDQAVLFTFVEGKYIRDPQPEHAMAAGEYLARFHLASSGYFTEYQKVYDNKKAPLTWLKAWKDYQQQGIIKNSPLTDISSYIQKVEEVNTFATHCHGDLSPINFHFDPQKGCRLIDFQNVAYGPAIIDLANGMAEFGARSGEFRMENLQAFRRGYVSIRPLTKDEDDALHALVVVQIAARQSRLLRLHYGGYGYRLFTERLEGLEQGLSLLLGQSVSPPCDLPLSSSNHKIKSESNFFSPKAMGFRLTYHCNARCRHCYCFDPQDRVTREKVDIATAERAIDEAHGEGVCRLGLSGGEPFLLPDHVFALVERAKRYNFAVNIATNAFWGKRAESAKRHLHRLRDLGFMPPKDTLTVSVGEFHLEHIDKSCSMHVLKHHYEIFHQGIRRINFEYNREHPEILTDYITYLESRGVTNDYYSLRERTVFQSIGQSLIANAEAVVKLPISSFDRRCNWLNVLIIEPSGNVLPCCGFNRYNKGIVLGNVYRDSVSKILADSVNHPAMRLLCRYTFANLHEVLQKGGYSLAPEADGLCNICQTVFGYKNHVDFLTKKML